MQTQYIGCTITNTELDDLSARHPQGNFQQTSHMLALAEHHGATTECVGVRDAATGALEAGALVAYTRSRFGIEGSIWLGPLCDTTNTELLQAMTATVRQSARSHHAVSVTCWPDEVIQHHESDGTATGGRNDAVITTMTRAGWRHGGFTTGYGTVVNRWNYVKDLSSFPDEKALLDSYDKRTQWSVKRAKSMGVHVRELGDDELSLFAEIERQTATRRGFATRDERYFHDFHRAFGNLAHFMLAEIHIDEYTAHTEAKIRELSATIATLQSRYEHKPTSKIKRQLEEEHRNLAAANKRLNDAHSFAHNGAILPAACSLFVEHPREYVYFFSGSVERYKPFYAPALIQHEAMSYCLQRGIQRYNFYGISGVFDDPDDEGHGVLEFKQGFNGYVEELVGEFTLPVRPALYSIQHLMHRITQ